MSDDKLTMDITDAAEQWYETYGVQFHKGWEGCFTTNQADGALSNGARVRKSWAEEGDRTPLNVGGTVLGSIPCPFDGGKPLYFIEWDDKPRKAIGIIGEKITAEV